MKKKMVYGVAGCLIGGLLFLGCGASNTVSQEDYDALKQQLNEVTAQLGEMQTTEKVVETSDSSESAVEQTEESNTDVADVTEEKDHGSSEGVSQEPVISFTGSEIDIEDGFEVLSDYTYWYSGLDTIEHIIVIKNNTDRNVKVDSSSVIYSENGDMIGLCDSNSGSGIRILGPGETSAIHEYSSERISEDIGNYKTKVTVSDSKETPFYGKIDYSITTNPTNVIIEATNNSDVTINHLMACFIYFKDGELADFDRVSLGSDIEPGATVYGDTSSYNEFDAVNLYFYGY